MYEDACAALGAPGAPAAGNPCASPLDEEASWLDAELSARLLPSDAALQLRNASGVGAGALLFVGPEGMTVAAVTDIAAAAGTGSATVARAARGAAAAALVGALPAGETALNASGLAGAGIAAGATVQVGEELLLVSAVDYVAGSATVARAQEGTSDAGHADGAAVRPLWEAGTRVRVAAPRVRLVFSAGARRAGAAAGPAPPAFPQGYALNGAVAVERGALYKAPPRSPGAASGAARHGRGSCSAPEA